MEPNKLIDKRTIGRIDFEAYIIEDEKKLLAFAIYFQKHQTPLLLFQQNIPNEKVEIIVNKDLVSKLQLLKPKDEKIRKEQYIEFRTFVLEAEQQAKELVFKDKRLEYYSDVNLLKSIKQAYLS